jgi:hypothetical protein
LHSRVFRGGALRLTLALLLAMGLSMALTAAVFSGGREERADMDKRFKVMKEKSPDFSITVFSPAFSGSPATTYGEVLCLLLERANLMDVELSEELFYPPIDAEVSKVDNAFRAFVQKNPVKTDYAIFGEYVAPSTTDVTAIRTFVLDGNGKPVWTDSQTPTDADFQRVRAKGPDGAALLLAEKLCAALGLPDPRRRGAPYGKWAAHFSRMAGAPTDSVYTAMDERLKVMRKEFRNSRVLVFPAITNEEEDAESATRLATLLNENGLCRAKAAPGDTSFMLEASGTGAEMLWDLARRSSERVKGSELEADYFLHPRYIISEDAGGNRAVVYVHLVLCDANGEWVIVDSQDEYSEDFEALSPGTASDCDKLVTIRLLRYVVPPKVTGIGASLRKDASGDLLVVGVAEKGPAAEAGVRAGDVIIAVEGQAVRKLTINEAVSRITGEAGTEVDITIRRGTETLEFTIIRREVVYE